MVTTLIACFRHSCPRKLNRELLRLESKQIHPSVSISFGSRSKGNLVPFAIVLGPAQRATPDGSHPRTNSRALQSPTRLVSNNAADQSAHGTTGHRTGLCIRASV